MPRRTEKEIRIMRNLARYIENYRRENGEGAMMRIAERYAALKGISVNPSTISQIYHGRKGVTEETALVFCKIFGIQLKDLTEEISQEDLTITSARRVPVFEPISNPPKGYTEGGLPVPCEDHQYNVSNSTDPYCYKIVVEKKMVESGNDELYMPNGSLRIVVGDRLLVEPNTPVRDHDLVVHVLGGVITICRYREFGDKAEIRPITQSHPSIRRNLPLPPDFIIHPITSLTRSTRYPIIQAKTQIPTPV